MKGGGGQDVGVRACDLTLEINSRSWFSARAVIA